MIAPIRRRVDHLRRAVVPARRRVLFRALRAVARCLGYQVIADSMYSPVPSLPAAGSALWTRRSELAGIELDPTSQLGFLETRLAPYLAEFRPPLDRRDAGGGFHLDNGYYGRGDAEILYAMVRWSKPRRLLELGAGYSTWVSGLACRRNAEEGHAVEFVSIDPHPRLDLAAVPALTRLERASATAVALERFAALGAGDILFIDTTHTVKLGGDVNYLVLEVLPRLRPGVVVHFHDIYLPYEYPRSLLGGGTFLSEQYLLQAFLAFNAGYRVLIALHALARDHPERLARTLPGVARASHGPSAFWIARAGADGNGRPVP